MSQLFHPGANALSRLSLAGLLLLIAVVVGGMLIRPWTTYVTQVDQMIDQPVPFSHEHHVAGLGIDCRYCHMHAEQSATAGLPSTETCMTCHASIWTNAELLAPVRESYRTGEPLRWNRVHDTPDFVYFNHAVHVNNGIGCGECHGNVERMPLMAKTQTLHMRWCLECHRHPEVNLRPKEAIYDTTVKPVVSPEQRAQLSQEYQINASILMNCTACHR